MNKNKSEKLFKIDWFRITRNVQYKDPPKTLKKDVSPPKGFRNQPSI